MSFVTMNPRELNGFVRQGILKTFPGSSKSSDQVSIWLFSLSLPLTIFLFELLIYVFHSSNCLPAIASKAMSIRELRGEGKFGAGCNRYLVLS